MHDISKLKEMVGKFISLLCLVAIARNPLPQSVISADGKHEAKVKITVVSLVSMMNT
jgi:hypothetical protein